MSFDLEIPSIKFSQSKHSRKDNSEKKLHGVYLITLEFWPHEILVPSWMLHLVNYIVTCLPSNGTKIIPAGV